MARRLVPVLAIAALAAACSTNNPSQGSTIDPGARATTSSTADAGRDGRGRGGPGGMGRGEQALLQNITLNADQQQRIDTIRARYRTQMEQMRGQNSGDRDATRAQMRTMMEKQQAEIRAVLTPDQQVVFDKNIADMRARMGQGRPQ